ncbi:outer membrane beta-barrel protein [bacterium SCSIO 12643]|nr:outer membrane beta-barrel protein [bacterium SCSIO 12643]
MKKLSILILVFLAFTSTQAQEHKLQIGVLGGVDSYFEALKHEPYGPDYEYGWSTGISLQHNIMQRFSLHYRVLYREEKMKFNLYPFCGTGLSHEDYIGKGTSTSKSMIVPVLAKWTFGQKKLHWMVDIGIQAQLNFEYVWQHEPFVGYSYSGFSNWRELYLGVSSGVGMSYDVTDRISVTGEFRAVDFDLISDLKFYKHDLNGQLMLGVSYGL